jgi:serine/threonine protein phosphatase 1
MIVIGDVHGNLDLLLSLMDKLPQTNNICFVGDLIDRGSQSKEVLDFIMENNYKSVLGNHEDMMLNNWRMWELNGAKKTLDSFGTTIYEFEKDCRKYLDWIAELPILIKHEHYLISHSYAYDGEDTYPSDVLWSRTFIKDNCLKTNIFGHTPVKKAQKLFDRHWNIDTGAYWTGKLSAIDLTTEKIYTT